MKFVINPLNRKIGIFGLGQIIQQSVSFLLLPVYVNYLTEAEFGSYSTLFALGGLLSIIYSLSIDKSIYRLYHDQTNARDRKIYLFNVVVLFLGASVIFLLISFGVLSNVMIFKSIPFKPLILLTILIFYLDSFRKILVSILRVTDNINKYFFLILFQVVTRMTAVSYILIVEDGDVFDLFQIIFLTDLVVILVFLFFIRNNLIPKFKNEYIYSTIAFTLPLIPTVLLAWVLNFSDRLLIERFIGINEVGHYNLMYRIAMVGSMLSNSYYLAISPEFYRMAKENNINGVKKLLNTYIWISGFLCFGVLIFSKSVIHLISPESFHYAIFIVPFIVLGYAFSMMTGIFNLFIYQAKRTKQILVIFTIITFINLSINFIFMQRYGIIVPAISTFITYLINYVIMYFYVKNVYFIELGINKKMGIIFMVLIFVSYFIYA